MAQGPNKVAAFNIGLSLIPTLVQSVENYFGAGNGADKRAAVLGAVSGVAAGVLGVVGVANPAYQNLIGFLIDAFVNHHKAQGVPIVPVNSPLPVAA